MIDLYPKFVVVFFALTSPALAFSASLKDLAADALVLPTAKSQGHIDGDEAKAFRALLGTDAPVRATVIRLSKYRQEGCGRLQIDLDVPGQTVTTKSGQKHPMATGFQMDLCVDGQPPIDKRPG